MKKYPNDVIQCGSMLSKLGFSAEDEMSLLVGYCVIQFGRQAKLEQGWRYPLAACRDPKNYDKLQQLFGADLPSTPDMGINEFAAAYTAISEMTPTDYLFNVTPNLITDIGAAHAFIEDSTLSKFELAAQIYVVKKVYRDSVALGANAYRTYCDYIANQSCLSKFQKEEFHTLSDAINHYAMHHTAVSYAKAKQAIDVYSAYGLQAEHQMELYSRINNYLKNRSMKEIVDPYQYVRACMGIHDDFDAFAHLEESFNRAAKFVGGGKITPNQFWETLHIAQNKYTNDGIESNYVQAEFCTQSFRDKKVLIINPTPTFVRTYMAKASMLRADESVIVVPWESLAIALDSEYCGSGSQFLPMSAINTINPSAYDSILIFSRDHVVEYFDEIGFWQKLQQRGGQDPTCLILGNDREIQKLHILLTPSERKGNGDAVYCIDAIL